MSSTGKGTVTTRKFIAFAAGFCVLVIILLLENDGFVRIIDDANLLFHEAGHLIFGVFGDTPGLYGGTLGQLIIPLICMIAFLMKKSYVSMGITLLWFFENFINISVYIGDARAHKLILVGGGKHDWTAILSGLGQLQNDTAIAGGVRTAGWAGLFITFTWIAFLWWRQKKNREKSDLPAHL